MFAMGPAFFKAASGGYATLTLSGTFANATVGVPYSSSIPISGGLEPYSLTGGTGVMSGALDSGFSLSITGTTGARFLTLSCASPVTADTMAFTASVGSSDGQTATSVQSVTVSAAGADPYWANVSALLYFDETSGTAFADQVAGNIWTPTGAIGAYTNEGNPFGPGGSAQFSGGSLTSQSSAAFGFGAGPYTVEGFIKLQPYSTNKCITDFRNGNVGVGIYSSENGSAAGNRLVIANNSAKIAGDNSPQWPASTWVHWAVCRDGSGVVRGFIGGVQSWSVTDARTYATTTTCVIGTDGATPSLSNMAQFRVTKGVARYTADFTPPTAPFPNS